MLKRINLLIFIICTMALSCTKNAVDTNAFQSENNIQKEFKIGQRYGGGVIFYIDSTGQHGLIADTVDLDKVTWYNGTFILTGASEKALYTGLSNTQKIVFAQGKTGMYAALACSESEHSGVSDWYLPSKNELGYLYKQKKLIGRFTADGIYCSSTEKTAYYEHVIYFIDGNETIANKGTPVRVRAIRAF